MLVPPRCCVCEGEKGRCVCVCMCVRKEDSERVCVCMHARSDNSVRVCAHVGDRGRGEYICRDIVITHIIMSM